MRNVADGIRAAAAFAQCSIQFVVAVEDPDKTKYGATWMAPAGDGDSFYFNEGGDVLGIKFSDGTYAVQVGPAEEFPAISALLDMIFGRRSFRGSLRDTWPPAQPVPSAPQQAEPCPFKFDEPPSNATLQEYIGTYGTEASDWARIAMEGMGIHETHAPKYKILEAYMGAFLKANDEAPWTFRTTKPDFLELYEELEALVEYKYPGAPHGEHFLATAVRMLKYYDSVPTPNLDDMSPRKVERIAAQRLGKPSGSPVNNDKAPHVDQGFDRLRRMGTDAEKWRDEFFDIFGGQLLRRADNQTVDFGATLFGWFANAIQAGITEGEQRATAKASDDAKNRVATAFEDGMRQGHVEGFEAGYTTGYGTMRSHITNHMNSRGVTLHHDAKSHAHAWAGGSPPMVADAKSQGVDDVAKG